MDVFEVEFCGAWSTSCHFFMQKWTPFIRENYSTKEKKQMEQNPSAQCSDSEKNSGVY